MSASAGISVKIPVSMSTEEFLSWEPGDGRLWQLVDGEPLATAPPDRTHGALQMQLARMIENHLVQMDSPCTTVITPGIMPHVNASQNVRIPDLAVTCSPYETEQAVLHDPLLIAEIISVSNHAETWANVWTYTTIPSVREILVLHTGRIRAELLRRGPDGAWPPGPEITDDGDIALDSITLHLPMADLYRTTRLRRRPPA